MSGRLHLSPTHRGVLEALLRERLTDDPCWQCGVPSKGNANLAGIRRIVHHLASAKNAGVVLVNGSMKLRRIVSEPHEQQAENVRRDEAIAANLEALRFRGRGS